MQLNYMFEAGNHKNKLNLIENRKGISPIIATILLIGVAVFAVGGIYSFTQGQLTALQSQGETPRPILSLPTAAEQTSEIFCGSGNGVILSHEGQDTVNLNNLEFTISKGGDATPITITPEDTREVETGRNIGMFGTGGGSVSVAIPQQEYCEPATTEGSLQIAEGESISVTVRHEPTDNVLFEDSVTARNTLTSYP